MRSKLEQKNWKVYAQECRVKKYKNIEEVGTVCLDAH